jgi:hypothetical protein
MFRSMRPKTDLALAFAGAAVLVLVAFGQVSGGTATTDSPLAAQITAPASSCPIDFQNPEKPAFLALDGGACRADAVSESFLSARPPGRPKTCRCSCGAPCETDADCGGAVGSCRVGVTCC